MFWVISVYFNVRNILRKSGTFPPGHSVYNTDETGVSTIVQSLDNVAQIGTKQFGQAVSDERGTMITVCMIISSVGNTVPPVFIFPRARLHDSPMFGAPPGSFGLVNSPQSSWITGYSLDM